LDINFIQTHFGIGAANHVTGMRLELSSTISAATIDGMASASLLNANMVNVTVPEPSTWALLLSGLGAAGAAVWRRRRS
jgi:hypothetical protein